MKVHKNITKMNKTAYILGFSILIFTACGNEGSETEDNTQDSTVSVQVNTPVPDSVANNIPDLQAEVNPPHGEPGHRCDIAVGAPLNSPPGEQQAAPQVQQVQPNLSTQPNQAAQPAAGQKLNPAHGEPGHDCSIAVGAPLPN